MWSAFCNAADVGQALGTRWLMRGRRNMSSVIARVRVGVVTWLTALMACFAASAASAETLMMPDRVSLTTVNTVVWGVTDQANGMAYSIDFGDGSPVLNGNVVDRSYIAFNHTYALANTYTATLTVGAQSATVDIQVYNPGPPLTEEALRGVNINRAIEDALRYLWVNQTDRAANFPSSVTTNWAGIDGYDGPSAALETLAFVNHGYKLPNNNTAPTGLYEKYIVRRGINQVLNLLETANLTMEAAGNPCVGSGAGPDPDGAGAALCVGLVLNQDNNVVGEFNFNHSSYETPFAAVVLAGSGTPNRTVAEIPGTGSGGYVVGKSYAEILQRLANAIVWGQQEAAAGSGRGGWYYALDYQGNSDGSTVGWVMLGLLDAEASGATIPMFARSEWSAHALINGTNADGSFDYQSDANANSNSLVNVAKSGVGIQGRFFAGLPAADVGVQDALTYISNRWNNQGLGQSFPCNSGTFNKGCGYGMFNVFKGLKLYNVQTLPGVGRPAGPGAIPANDWYADYIDWLLTHQTSPTAQTGGHWAGAGVNNLIFSSQTANDPAEAALALLILSPVVLIQPDPETFGEVGLRHLIGGQMSTDPDSNPVNTPHTVTAFVESSGGAPIVGATVSFQVSGRNTATGSGVSDGNGQVSFSYKDVGPASPGGQDQIRAFIGQVGSNTASNVLLKNWVSVASVLKLNVATAPGSGKAGVSTVAVTGAMFPAGAYTAAEITVFVASTCMGANPASAPGKTLTTIAGNTRRVTFLIPATAPTGAGFVWVAGPGFASTNCSKLTVVP